MPNAKDHDIPVAFLRECFSLDDTSPTGLRWRERPRVHFVNEGAWRTMNTRCAGKPAGSLSGSGAALLASNISGESGKIRPVSHLRGPTRPAI